MAIEDEDERPGTGVATVYWDNLRFGWGMVCLCGQTIGTSSSILADAADEMEAHWEDDPRHEWPPS